MLSTYIYVNITLSAPQYVLIVAIRNYSDILFHYNETWVLTANSLSNEIFFFRKIEFSFIEFYGDNLCSKQSYIYYFPHG